MSVDVVYRVTIAKQHLADALGVSSSLLHIPAGLLLLLAFGLGFCGSVRRWPLSLAGVCAIQVANEILDAVQWVRWTGEVNWAEAARDAALTLCTPVMVVVALELRRGRIGPKGEF
ncbi:MAG: hypothetical protein HOJ21_11030 [Alphaproteobacteria bacterium]|nr:hypothetical protein [Alphaproteobacteria bacterium]